RRPRRPPARRRAAPERGQRATAGGVVRRGASRGGSSGDDRRGEARVPERGVDRRGRRSGRDRERVRGGRGGRDLRPDGAASLPRVARRPRSHPDRPGPPVAPQGLRGPSRSGARGAVGGRRLGPPDRLVPGDGRARRAARAVAVVRDGAARRDAFRRRPRTRARDGRRRDRRERSRPRVARGGRAVCAGAPATDPGRSGGRPRERDPLARGRLGGGRVGGDGGPRRRDPDARGRPGIGDPGAARLERRRRARAGSHRVNVAARPDTRGRFGAYGGRYAPEILIPALDELTDAWLELRADAGFRRELDDLLRDFVGRPTPITHAMRLSEELGVDVWLKREDLAHTGAHKINNAPRQLLLAK